MKWATGFIFLSLLRETLHQVISSSHSSSSFSSSSSSSSTSSNGQQGFPKFASESSNVQHFNSFGNRPSNNFEMHRMNQQPSSHQTNGVIKSESFTQNFGQAFAHPGGATHISPPKKFQNSPNSQPMMQRLQGHQFGPQNNPQSQQMTGERTDQLRQNVHHGQHWVQTASEQQVIDKQHPDQLMNIQHPGQIMNNQHPEQLMQEPHHRQFVHNQHPGQQRRGSHSGQQLLNEQHPAQHLLKEQHPGQQLSNEQHPGQHTFPNMHQGQLKNHQRSGPPPNNNQEQQLRTHNFGQQIDANGQQRRQTWFHNSGQQPPHESVMLQMGNNFQNNQLPNSHQWNQWQQNNNGDSGQNPGHGQRRITQGNQEQQSFNNHQTMKDQNKIPSLQGPRFIQKQQQIGPEVNNDGHHRFENFHTAQGHSFSTNSFGDAQHLQNTPQQFVKSASSVSTSNIGPNEANSFFKMPQFDRSLFPRNFIIPERRRTNAESMFPSMNNMNIPRPHETFGPERSQISVAPEHQSQNRERISQTSSGNLFGFEPTDRAQFGQGFFKPDQIQNMTSQTDVPFGNWNSQRWSSNPRDVSFNIDLKLATCTEEYQKLPNHTMCLADKANLNVSGVSDSDQAEIVRLHNEFRGTVMPEASDIFTMKWDDRLAIVAQKWANQCSRHHDRMRTVPSLGKHTLIGQNLAGGFSNWSSVIKEWWTENVIWRYGIEPSTYIPETSDVAETIGHYIQMTYNATYLVGCGFAYCDESQFEKYYVCNYAPGLRSYTHPFTVGERCQACPHWCRDGKCDCGGRVCNNGGTLSMRTCQCECGPLYAGPSCDILRCPFRDHPDCGVKYQKDHCVVLPEVNQDCPYMCDRCAQGHVLCGGRICFNGGVLKETTCQCSCSPPFAGETCEANCGDPDDAECQRWPDVFCHWNYQIQKQCPHRCKLCPTQ